MASVRLRLPFAIALGLLDGAGGPQRWCAAATLWLTEALRAAQRLRSCRGGANLIKHRRTELAAIGAPAARVQRFLDIARQPTWSLPLISVSLGVSQHFS
jgi:hypothetical protein